MSDRADSFLARIDAELLTHQDDAARRQFLARQLEGWEYRYARFVASEGASEPINNPADPPQAADFLLTITGLAARREALMSNKSLVARQDGRERPLASAILSLLVAADQRCPAIIGQAHILYYARGVAKYPAEDTAKAFAQLKRDAADLSKAIADVEASLMSQSDGN